MNQVGAKHQPEPDELRQYYIGYLKDSMGLFKGAVAHLKENPVPDTSITDARDFAHKVKGNAALYGFPGLGLKAETVERSLRTFKAEDEPDSAIFALINLLENIDEICSYTSKSGPDQFGPALAVHNDEEVPLSRSTSSQLNRKGILLAYEDPWLCDLLKSLLSPDFDVRECHDETEIISMLSVFKPDLIVLDDDLPKDGGVAWLLEMVLGDADIYLAFNADENAKIAEAIGAGVSGYSRNKTDILEISTNIRDMLERLPERILIVDDDLAVREMLRHHLESDGLRVDVVHDGIEALEYLTSETPDLIILDRFMPRLEGGTVLYEIQNRPILKNTPVLILTAMVNRGEAKAWFERGAADFIPKPFDPEEVAMRVKQHLESRRRIS